MLERLFQFIIALLPKQNKVVIFTEFGLDGNALAIYNYLHINRKDLKIIFLTKSSELVIKYRLKGIKSYDIRSLSGCFHYGSARIIFYTHQVNKLIKSSKNQVSVMLWHGMPIKRIGCLKNDEIEKFINFNKVDYFIATSPFYVKQLSKAFDVPEQKILPYGQPCQDILLNYDNQINIFLEKDIKEFNYVITYCPTFRKSDDKFSSSQTDLNFNKVYEKYFDRTFFEFCEKNKVLLVIKMHPAELQSINIKRNDNVLICDDDLFISKGYGFYEILARTDVLINDISSIIIDYAVLDRPIIFIMDDFDEYIEKVGTVFTDYKSILPGDIVETSAEMVDKLTSLLENKQDNTKQRRKAFNELVNSSYKGNSCESIICKIENEKYN